MLRATFVIAALAAFSTSTGCNSKAKECNRFTDEVAAHKTEIAAAVEQLGNIRSDASVTDAFSKQIASARERIGALDLADEQIAGYAKQWFDLLGEADQVNRDLAAAAATDREAIQRTAAAAADLAKREQAIIDAVNAYCQA
jgi:hypothetical protein